MRGLKVVSGKAEPDVFVSFEFEFRISLSSKFFRQMSISGEMIFWTWKAFIPLMLMWFPISLSWFGYAIILAHQLGLEL